MTLQGYLQCRTSKHRGTDEAAMFDVLVVRTFCSVTIQKIDTLTLGFWSLSYCPTITRIQIIQGNDKKKTCTSSLGAYGSEICVVFLGGKKNKQQNKNLNLLPAQVFCVEWSTVKCLQQVTGKWTDLCRQKKTFKAALVLLFKRPCTGASGCYDDNAIGFKLNQPLWAGTYVSEPSPIFSVSLQVN